MIPATEEAGYKNQKAPNQELAIFHKDAFMPKKKQPAKSRDTRKAAVTIGIIGGSGLYNMPGLAQSREVRLKTPFGEPSDALVVGTLEGKRVAFLARHGRGHRFLPSEINYRANIHAMKQLGVERIISVSAVGSLQEDLKPLDFLIPDQFFDRTRHRISTFFGGGVVAHVGFDKPVCGQLSAILADACGHANVRVHRSGTYICMEGPQFSTLAEAHVHRQMRFEVIGMTNVTEAKLAREAEICYATVAMITDYDCWHPDHASVTLNEILANLGKNTENAQTVLREAVRSMPADRACRCGSALAHAIVTDPKVIPASARKRLHVIAGKYLNPGAR
jgi:5'-methylthioadenosine phosphorylase